ncbi:MAG TPA: ATP phosphoribosyltransferase [Anaerolineaceae bacterium]|nr:ATP phosphoribosyltransferase [Anaerolineaceae bacterium]
MPQPDERRIRISLPSKGRLSEDSLAFLSACGLSVYKPNPRQYEAVIPALPGLHVLFQRPADIVVSVREGSVDFGITGLDVVAERRGENGDVLVLHDALGFGDCTLSLAIPETWETITRVEHLAGRSASLGRPLRVATKYPYLTGRFLDGCGLAYTLIAADGTLETAPAIGYADLICDIVSSGQTLRDNRLRPLEDGILLISQAALIANFQSLKSNPEALRIARTLLEFFEAHLRASENLAIFANMRGRSPEEIAGRILDRSTLRGLQGPTISRVLVQGEEQNWYAVNLIVRRDQIFQAITELREIGGSGVVVLPVTYIFDEEPTRYTAMLKALEA